MCASSPPDNIPSFRLVPALGLHRSRDYYEYIQQPFQPIVLFSLLVQNWIEGNGPLRLSGKRGHFTQSERVCGELVILYLATEKEGNLFFFTVVQSIMYTTQECRCSPEGHFVCHHVGTLWSDLLGFRSSYMEG